MAALWDQPAGVGVFFTLNVLDQISPAGCGGIDRSCHFLVEGSGFTLDGLRERMGGSFRLDSIFMDLSLPSVRLLERQHNRHGVPIRCRDSAVRENVQAQVSKEKPAHKPTSCASVSA